MVIENKYETETASPNAGKLGNLFDGIKKIKSNMEGESENFRNQFTDFVQSVAAFSKSKQDQEEKMILR